MTPEQAMEAALQVAKQGHGFVSPNPLVGCVIVDQEHRFLGQGAHLKYGEAHAEINALASVENPDLLKNAIVYVTLEPCAHEGQTGSCAKALAQRPIKKVVYGAKDPNPQVAGKGCQILESAGIEILLMHKYSEACLNLAEHFHYHMKNQKPFVSMKVGTSFDGKIALESGESQWMTSYEARQYARQLRGHYDATLVGGGTLKYDNPRLDFRDTDFAEKKQNKIVILDPKGTSEESFADSNILKIHGPKNIFVLTRPEHIDKWSKHLVRVIQWQSSDRGWSQALENLYQKGIHSLYVEGGAFVFGQLLSFQIAQKLYLFESNKIVGRGVGWSRYLELSSLETTPSLEDLQSFALGDERLYVGYLSYPNKK